MEDVLESAMLAVKSDSRFLSITLQPEAFDPDTAVNLKCIKLRKTVIESESVNVESEAAEYKIIQK